MGKDQSSTPSVNERNISFDVLEGGKLLASGIPEIFLAIKY